MCLGRNSTANTPVRNEERKTLYVRICISRSTCPLSLPRKFTQKETEKTLMQLKARRRATQARARNDMSTAPCFYQMICQKDKLCSSEYITLNPPRTAMLRFLHPAYVLINENGFCLPVMCYQLLFPPPCTKPCWM